MNFPHTETLPVRYRDTDAQGHMYFANYLVFADEALGAYWRTLGLTYEDPDSLPCYTFAVNANIDYVSECVVNDPIEVAVGFSRLGTTSAESQFELRNLRSGDIAARGSFTHVFTDKITRKSTPIPAAFRARVAEAQPELA